MKPLLIAFCAKILAMTNFGAHYLDDNFIEFKEVKIQELKEAVTTRNADGQISGASKIADGCVKTQAGSIADARTYSQLP